MALCSRGWPPDIGSAMPAPHNPYSRDTDASPKDAASGTSMLPCSLGRALVCCSLTRTCP
eukprot:5604287-Amphidinium_carterae.1